MTAVLVVPADGEGVVHRLDLAHPNDTGPLREAVGGWLELVRLDDELAILVDEEGALKQLAVNERASWLAGRIILGPAVLVGAPLGSLDITDVPADLLAVFEPRG